MRAEARPDGEMRDIPGSRGAPPRSRAAGWERAARFVRATSLAIGCTAISQSGQGRWSKREIRLVSGMGRSRAAAFAGFWAISPLAMPVRMADAARRQSSGEWMKNPRRFEGARAPSNEKPGAISRTGLGHTFQGCSLALNPVSSAIAHKLNLIACSTEHSIPPCFAAEHQRPSGQGRNDGPDLSLLRLNPRGSAEQVHWEIRPAQHAVTRLLH